MSTYDFLNAPEPRSPTQRKALRFLTAGEGDELREVLNEAAAILRGLLGGPGLYLHYSDERGWHAAIGHGKAASEIEHQKGPWHATPVTAVRVLVDGVREALEANAVRVTFEANAAFRQIDQTHAGRPRKSKH